MTELIVTIKGEITRFCVRVTQRMGRPKEGLKRHCVPYLTRSFKVWPICMML